MIEDKWLQKAELLVRNGRLWVTNLEIAAELRAAYREGMLRAAQICEGYQHATRAQKAITTDAEKLK